MSGKPDAPLTDPHEPLPVSLLFRQTDHECINVPAGNAWSCLLFDPFLNIEHGFLPRPQLVRKLSQAEDPGMIGKIAVERKDVIDQNRFVSLNLFKAGTLPGASARALTAGG